MVFRPPTCWRPPWPRPGSIPHIPNAHEPRTAPEQGQYDVSSEGSSNDYGGSVVTASIVHAAFAQELKDIHRIQDGVSRSHVEYHEIKVPRGKEMVLADLEGPGKIAYFYITPVSDLALKIFWDDETAPSIQRAGGFLWCHAQARPRTTILSPWKSSTAATCAICRCPLPSTARFTSGQRQQQGLFNEHGVRN